MYTASINSIDLNFDFERYFLLPGLCLPMKIGHGNLQEIFFHWADWSETCRVQMHLLMNSPHGIKKMEVIREKILGLKDIRLWVDRQGRKVQTNLKELYAAYTDPMLRHILFENSGDGFSISFSGPRGPFVDALALRWLKQDIFLNFIYINLLQGKIPYRQFRLRYEKEVATSIDGNRSINNIQIQQLSTEGILFKVPREVLLEWSGVNRFQEISPSVDFALLKQDFLLFSQTRFKIDIKEYLESFTRINAQNMTVKSHYPLFLEWNKFKSEKLGENFLETVLRPFLSLVREGMICSLKEFKETRS